MKKNKPNVNIIVALIVVLILGLFLIFKSCGTGTKESSENKINTNTPLSITASDDASKTDGLSMLACGDPSTVFNLKELNKLTSYKPLTGQDSLYKAYCNRVISQNDFNKIADGGGLADKLDVKFLKDAVQYVPCRDKASCFVSKKEIKWYPDKVYTFGYDLNSQTVKFQIYAYRDNTQGFGAKYGKNFPYEKMFNYEYFFNTKTVKLIKRYPIKNDGTVIKGNNFLHIVSPAIESIDKSSANWNELY
jgi:hypothetical protein